MSVQKRRYGRLSVTLVMLPLTALLSGCGGKAPETVTPDTATLSPGDQQKAAASTQKGVADEAARRQAEQEYLANKKNAGTAP